MNTVIALDSRSARPAARPAALRLLLPETRAEFLRLLRYPGFVIPTLTFPLMFYILFGIVFAGSRASLDVARHMLASYSTFGVMGPGLFGIGVAFAFERERGLLQLKRALPMPPGVYLGAKMLTAMLFAGVIGVELMLMARLGGHVNLTARQTALLMACNVLGVLPFCAVGLFIGSMVAGSAAPALTNFIYLPMAFLSGLWMPIWLLPQVLQTLAPLWPAYHLGQLAEMAVGSRNDGALITHVAVLAGFTLLFFRLAGRRLARS